MKQSYNVAGKTLAETEDKTMSAKNRTDVMSHVALAVVQFMKGRGMSLSTELGLAFISGLQSGLKAAGWVELADPIGDWPCQTTDELIVTINRWHRTELVISGELLDQTPFQG